MTSKRSEVRVLLTPPIKTRALGFDKIESSIFLLPLLLPEIANEQARLISNQELEKQAAVHKKELDKEKSARKP